MNGESLAWLLLIGLALICAFDAIARHLYRTGKVVESAVFTVAGLISVVVWSFIVPVSGVSWTMFGTVWMTLSVITWIGSPIQEEPVKSGARQ